MVVFGSSKMRRVSRWCPVAAGVVLVVSSLSCGRGTPPSPAATTESPLDRCIAAAYRRGGGHAGAQDPEAVTAARACVAAYVKLPEVDRWATHFGGAIATGVLRRGDDVFVERLSACAARTGMKVQILEAGGGTRSIEARRERDNSLVAPTDGEFLACASSAEKAEREMLAEATAE